MEPDRVWMHLTVTAAQPVLEALGSLLVDWGAGGIVEGDGEISAYYPPEERGVIDSRVNRYALDLGERVSWTWQTRHEEAWQDAWKAYFRPTRISPRLAVCPSWEEWTGGDPDVRVLRLDPGRAFGTGTHETTRLSLRLLDRFLREKPAPRFLDVGCGSGVLSLAARLLGVPWTVALDLDPLATAATRDNARQNEVQEGVLLICGEIRSVKGAFPLAAANILYQVLLGLAPALSERVDHGGGLILSGMLSQELPSAVAVYGGVGFREAHREVEGEWGALLLEKR